MHQRYDVVVVGGVFREIGADPTQSRLEIAGSGLTASVTSARFGARTALLASVGDEDVGVAVQVLGAAGVDQSWIQVTPGASGTFVFPAHADDERPWPMFRPAESPPRSDLPNGLPVASIYLLFGHPEFDPVAEGWLASIPFESTVLWDRQGWLSRARDWRTALDVPVHRRVYVANKDEGLAEFEVNDLEELMNVLPPTGFHSAVIKMGAAGCAYRSLGDGGIVAGLVGGFPVEVNSTIGSGDVFAGTLAAQLSRGVELAPALLMANATAAAYLAESRNVLSHVLMSRAQSFVDLETGES
jgi:sugar/nucleoside kinase (ribokinase family)